MCSACSPVGEPHGLRLLAEPAQTAHRDSHKTALATASPWETWRPRLSGAHDGAWRSSPVDRGLAQWKPQRPLGRRSADPDEGAHDQGDPT
ncbi:hypothetical protein ACFVJK_33310 [Streptomyces sp. NPDC127172]|uniref:hypothetical protein n=1 Tax=Streptomyces sp. NPDC127172 TaxID=3345382 RepID=UPI0036293EB9